MSWENSLSPKENFIVTTLNLILIFLGPEVKDLSTEFVKDILSGKKALLKLSSVLFVKNVPFWEEFTARNVWNSIKNERNMTKYFKRYNKSLP